MAMRSGFKRFRRKRRNKSSKPKTKVDKSLYNRIRKIEKNIEWKYYDNFVTNQIIPSEQDGVAGPAIAMCVNTPVLGAASNNRLGIQISGKLLKMRCTFRGNNQAVGDSRIRIQLVWFKNSNGLAPIAGQLMDLDTGSTGSFINPVYTFAVQNEMYRDSYKIVWDRTYILKPLDWNGTTTTIPDIKDIDRSFKLNRITRFVQGSGSPNSTEITDNALFLVFSTSSAYGAGSPAANNPVVEVYTRYFFTDD